MASFLDTGLLGTFSVIFTFLLVYAIVWGVLVSRKPIGDNNNLYAIISLAAAFFMVISTPARVFIEIVTPWFLTLGIVFFLIIISVSMFSEVKWNKVIENSLVQTWIIILIVIVLIGGLAQTFGQLALDTGAGERSAPANSIPVTDEYGQVIDAAPSLQEASRRATGPGATSSGNYDANLVNTLIHPKVLGMMLILILSSMIIYFLSKPAGGL